MKSSVNGSPQLMNLEYATWQRQYQLLVSWLLSSMSESILHRCIEYDFVVSVITSRVESHSLKNVQGLLLAQEIELSSIW
ncbi:hypothetical protein CK203_094644 [Vitis vinifera]|uniref:Uncharacterized protein n=1 Tax=Vitis vinifera TaxID=29760 RepID=A0A438CKX3_VITVI|nr:hypothetical protein CK203_094644 [Vitis vinifera]